MKKENWISKIQVNRNRQKNKKEKKKRFSDKNNVSLPKGLVGFVKKIK